MSQEYVRDAKKIYEGNIDYIMLLLEDLHRAYSGLPTRKRGRSYHGDGPYIVKTTTTRERSSLTPQRSYSNISHISNESKFIPFKKIESPNTSFSRKLIANSKSAMDFYKPPPTSIPVKTETKENYEGFAWLKKIELKLPDSLDLTAAVIPELSNGEIFCKLLSILEMKDIEGVKKCNVGTPQAKRNIKLAFDVLKKKPNLTSKALYIEDKIWQGEGTYIRLILSEIYRIYKNAIHTLIKFNRKYRGSSFM